MEKKITFGDNVRRIRQLIEKERGIFCSQEEFGGYFGRARSQVANWESQNRKTLNDKMQEIAEIFGIPLETLKYGYVNNLGPGWETRLSRPKAIISVPKRELFEELEAARSQIRGLEKLINRVEELIEKAEDGRLSA